MGRNEFPGDSFFAARAIWTPGGKGKFCRRAGDPEEIAPIATVATMTLLTVTSLVVSGHAL
jgi:hypothetical protein